MAENEINHPGRDHKLLEVFVGEWTTTGHVKAHGGNPQMPVTAIDTYQWLAGGYFLEHRFEARIGEDTITGVELIGYDETAKNYPMYSFDSQGNSVLMHATVDKNVWSIVGETERSRLVVDDDENGMTAHWERLDEDENWIAWMEVRLVRR